MRTPVKTLIAAALAVAALSSAQPASAASCSGTTGTTYTNAVTSSASLVSYWRLGESSGSGACDSWGSNAGTYTGGYTLGVTGAIAGESSTAAGFNGSTGYVSVPH